MHAADSDEYWLDELVKGLNNLHTRAIADGKASAYMDALDDVAEFMDISSTKVYKR
jgi:hypothetical protein